MESGAQCVGTLSLKRTQTVSAEDLDFGQQVCLMKQSNS